MTVRQDLRGETVIDVPLPPGPTRGRRAISAIGLACLLTFFTAMAASAALVIEPPGRGAVAWAASALALVWLGFFWLGTRLRTPMTDAREPRLRVTPQTITSEPATGAASAFEALPRAEVADLRLVTHVWRDRVFRRIAWQDGEGRLRQWRGIDAAGGGLEAWRVAVAAARRALGTPPVAAAAPRGALAASRVRLPGFEAKTCLWMGVGVTGVFGALLALLFAGSDAPQIDATGVVLAVLLPPLMGLFLGGGTLLTRLSRLRWLRLEDGQLLVTSGMGRTMLAADLADLADVRVIDARIKADDRLAMAKTLPRLCVDLAGGAGELLVLEPRGFGNPPTRAALERIAGEVRAAAGLRKCDA